MKHMKIYTLAAVVLAAVLAGCKKEDTPKDPLLSFAERYRFSVVGKMYIHYCTEDTEVPYYEVRHFVNADSIKRYTTDRADGQVGEYSNIEYYTYYLSYPYITTPSQRDTLYTFIQDSIYFKNNIGELFYLYN